MAAVSSSSGSKERVADASSILCSAFREDPAINYVLSAMKPEARDAYFPKYFNTLVTAAAMNKAIIHEADGWKSCGVLMPPRCRVDNPVTIIQAGLISLLWYSGLTGCRRMLAEFQPLADAMKAKAFAGQKDYYYVFFVGTRPDSRGRGLCSIIMRQYQEIATRAQIPIWLEATTTNSRRLYERLGWEVFDEIVLGKGRAGPDGFPSEGGEGVKIWGMIWRPKPVKEESRS